MVRVGCHVSIAGGIDKAVERAVKKGCDLFQIFTRNPRGWRYSALNGGTVMAFREAMERSGIGPAVAHMPYLPNLASPREDVLAKSVDALITELERCEILGIPYLVTHLGSHLGTSMDEAVEREIRAIRTALDTAESGTILLLENTSGSAHSLGSTFTEIARIIDGVGLRERTGVCFDTCHAFAAGYELRTTGGLEETVREIDRVIGIEKLKVIHLNDSLGDLGSGLDRHEHIGLGRIGEDAFRRILHHPNLRDVPCILETPVDERRDDVGNIRVVRQLAA
ncbi:MAG: deoxyribonuclease IV [Methanoculleaceae archaeon]